MATLLEIAGITGQAGWNDFSDKVKSAAVIKAAAVIDAASPPAARLEWAKSAITDPVSAKNSIIFYVVGTNNTASIAQILGATEALIQTNVDAAVDAIYS